MKIVQITCPNCGGKLEIDDEKKKDYCQYCGTPIILDDEIKRVHVDVTEEAGYKFEKGRIRAHEEKIQEEQEARIREQQEIKKRREEEIERRRIEQVKRTKETPGKGKASRILLTVTLVIVGVALLFSFFCCLGTSFLGRLFGKVANQASDQINETASQIKYEEISSLDEIDEIIFEELKAKADERINDIIKESSLDVKDYKDVLEDAEYIGYCFANDESIGNELFFIYQLNNKTETIDNVNLRRFSDERKIYYYIGFTGISKNGEGKYLYDNSIIDEPTEMVPDFTAKNTYVNIYYKFTHKGYPFISLLFDDLERKYATVEYYPGKDVMIKSVHQEKVNILNYSDNIPHCNAMWFDDGYTDESGEYYEECMYAYTHSAFTDPVCLDYRIGSEYSKLSFTCGTWPGRYGENSSVFVRVIDKDTFDVIYESENIVANHSISCDVDITNHKNIRLQFIQVSKDVEYSMIKDVILSD